MKYIFKNYDLLKKEKIHDIMNLGHEICYIYEILC